MITSQTAYSILNIDDNTVLTKNGDISMFFFLKNPEPYSLTEKKLDDRLNSFYIALRQTMPDYSYFQKQDLGIRKTYNPENHYFDNSYLSQAQKHHLKGRKYGEHTCIIIFTLSRLKSLEAAYVKNPLSYKDDLEAKDKDRFFSFYEAVTGATSVLNSIYETSVSKMRNTEIKYYIKRYVNGFQDEKTLYDLNFAQETHIGNTKYAFFSLSSGSYFPETFSNVVNDTSLIRKNVELKRGFMDDIGVFFPYNHIYNQVLFFKGNKILRDELEERRSTYSKHQKYSGSIKRTSDRLKNYQKKVLDEDLTLVKSHYSVILFDDDKTILKESVHKLKNIFSNKEITHYSPSYEGAENLFMGTIPVRNSQLDASYYFLNDAETALSLFTNYGDYKDDQDGIVLFDRITNKPFFRDTLGTSRTGGLAKNFCIIAPTEGGKSSLAQDLVNQDLLNNTKVIYVEFGESAANLTKIYPEKSVQIKFTPSTPIGINPFDIDPDNIQASQLLSLNQIVLKYWKVDIDARTDNDLNSSIVKLLQDYYQNFKGAFSFPTFYHYVKDNFIAISSRKNIPQSSFDLESFLNVCVHFLPGEMYENVCLPNPHISGSIQDKDLIVFELTEVKEDPFMISIIYTILQDTVNEKIIADRNISGALYYDEYGETVMLKDQFTGEAIHPTVAYGFQKFRKSNAKIGIILQTPDQLPDDQYTKGIIANTQLLYVLPSTTVVYDSIIKNFKIRNQEHIDLMLSLENNFKGTFPRYSEVFIRFIEKYAVVGRLEFSPQKLYAFQTDGADWQYIHDDYKNTNDIPTSINNLIIHNNEKTDFIYNTDA